MSPHQRPGFLKGALAIAFVATALACLNAGAARAGEGRPLQLDVTVNGTKANLLGSFVQLADGRLAARRGELKELGIKAPGEGNPDEEVVLDTVVGSKFRYDEPTQSIAFDLTDDQRIARAFDALGGSGPTGPIRTSWGSVLNYTLFGSETSGPGRPMTFSGGSAALDGRIFSPYGTLSQSGILGTTTTRDLTALRLDTTFAYSDPDSLITYRGGDAITGGLNWTRPIRFGGVQMQRNFGLRSDLITAPLPTFAGSAAVPSTLDVYMNNTKTYTQDVPPGPFQVNNLPLVSGGEARIVLRDATGREVETTMPFYTSARLLKEGLTYFSAEGGAPRTGYGTSSDSYVDKAFAAASVRHGVYDWLTLEGHAEAAAGFYNGGGGAVIRTGNFGVLSLAASGSTYSSQNGIQAYAAFETKFWGMSLNASSTRTFSTSYNDLASITAPTLTLINTLTATAVIPAATSPPKALDRVSLGMRLPDRSSLGLSFVHLEPAASRASNLVSVAWSRPIFENSQLFVTAFSDVSDKKSYGLFAGVSIPLGDRTSVSTGATSSSTGTSFTTDASRPLGMEIGNYGWRVRDSEGASGYRSGAGSYRGSAGTVQAGVEQSANGVRTLGQADGAIAFLGNNVFFSNRIDDSFAVVDTGAPRVPVFYENRPYGETDKNGQLLIPNLRAYGNNKIAIDPTGLPVTAEIEKTSDVVTPADRSGVLVSFKAKTDVQNAVVVFHGANGKPLPVGSKGKIDGSDDAFVVGYDGRSFVKDLKSSNTAVLTTGAGECRASFDYAPAGDRQIVIGPIACQ
jgi:outer membrane usher protein